MAKLKTCKSCKQEIAKSAKSCPHCGAKNKKPGKVLLVLAAIVAVIVVIAVATSGDSNPRPDSADGYIKVTAEQLYKEYNENGTATTEKYKDKWIAVTGKVSSVGENNRVYLDADDFISSVGCSMESSEHEQVLKVKKGDKLTVYGMWNGTFLTDPELKSCRFKP
jgi:hypothetical protein